MSIQFSWDFNPLLHFSHQTLFVKLFLPPLQWNVFHWDQKLLLQFFQAIKRFSFDKKSKTVRGQNSNISCQKIHFSVDFTFSFSFCLKFFLVYFPFKSGARKQAQCTGYQSHQLINFRWTLKNVWKGGEKENFPIS